jgi:hypothetical protein
MNHVLRGAGYLKNRSCSLFIAAGTSASRSTNVMFRREAAC